MIDINWTLWVQAANFIVLLLFLNHFVFKPVLAHLEKREAEMQAMRDEADDLRRKGEEALVEYDSGVENIRAGAAAAVAEARKQAQDETSGKLSAARKDFEAQIEKARAGIRKDTEAASAALKGEINLLAKSMAGKILGRSV